MAITYKKVSNVDLMPAIDGISRKLALRRETCYDKVINKGGDDGIQKIVIPGHTYMGVTTRDIRIIGYGTTKRVRLFMRKPMATPQATIDQAEQRADFAIGAGWTNAAMKDLTVIAANQQKFLAATQDLTKKIGGVSAAGYQTMRGWMTAVAVALQKADKLPETHALPNFDA